VAAVRERYESCRRQVADAADCAGRSAQDVSIVAVTKHVGVEDVRAAIAAGAREFGENRVQEFLGKYGLFPGVDWHFIGTLQRNKVKDVVGRTCLIHSVDSVKLLQEIDRRAAERDVVQPVLVQVNASGEHAKHGFEPRDVADTLVDAASLGHVHVRGLMTMAPLARPEDVRWVFRSLRELSESLRGSLPDGVELDELSMGMSNDFRVAVEEGATIVRLGRAIFGK
jgi:pyridoxal phosphate enzyme (YggS family)